MKAIISDTTYNNKTPRYRIQKTFHTSSLTKIFLILLVTLSFIFLTAASCRGADNDDIKNAYTAGKTLYDQGKYKESIVEFQKGLELAQKSGNKKKMLAFLSAIGLSYRESGNLQKAGKALSESADLAGEEGIPDMEAFLNQELGDIYFDMKNFKKSAERLEKALKYAEEKKDTETISTIQGKLADSISRLGRIAEANDYYRKALVYAREKKDKQKEMYYLGNIGLNYTFMEKSLKAMEYLEQAITLGEELKDKGSLSMWQSTAADILFEMGNYEKALNYYKRAMENAQAVNDRIAESLILRSLGSSYYGLGKYKEAIVHYEKALAIVREMKEIPAEGMILGSLGNVYSSIGENKKALEYMKKALEIAEKTTDKRDDIWQLGALGLFYLDTGKYKEAIPYYKRALKIAEESGDVPAQARILSEMFTLYLRIGDIYESAQCMNEALKRAKDNTKIQGSIFTGLGISYMRADRYREALESFRKALKLAKETNNLKDEIICLNYVADVYKQVGKYSQALKYQQQTLDLLKKTDNLYMKIALLNSMGEIYKIQKEFDKALSIYKESLALSEKTGGKRTYYTTLKLMADLYYARGEKEKALELYKKIRDFYREMNDEENESNILLFIANFYSNENKYDEARKYAVEVEKIAGKNQNSLNLYTATRLLSYLALAGKDEEKALTYLKKAIAISEEMFAKIRIDRLKIEHFGSSSWFKDQYDQIITLLLSHGKTEEALEYSEKARARTFLNNLQGRRILPKNEEQKELARQEMLLSDEIKGLQKKLSQVSGMDEEGVSLRQKIKSLMRERDNLLLKISLENPEYASLRTVRVSTPKEIRESLLPGEAIIEYFTGSTGTFAWCITKEKVTIYRISLNSEQVDSTVTEIRESLPDGSREETAGKIAEKLKGFYSQIFKPMEKDLEGINCLVIVPHGALHKFPFAILQKENGKYLLEDFAILTEPSASAFVLFRNRKAARPHNAVQFALGNMGSEKAGKNGEESRGSLTDDDLSAIYRGGFSPLPGTKEEVKDIKEILDEKGIKNSSFIEKDFTYDKAFKASPNAGYLHFATHGFISDSFMGQYSGLITGDEPIFVLDIFDWNLNARMIVLSACKTGLGYQSKGDDMVSLSRAFMQAGTDNLTATLWVVEDQTTRKLMVDFYANLLKGMTPQESLRQAQLDVMKTNRDPFYWGPFVMYGKGVKEEMETGK